MRFQILFDVLESRLLLAVDVNFAIDAALDVHPISPYIYGVNEPLSGAYANATFRRAGGNRWTAYNWENNASNAGSDFNYQNDAFLGGGNTPGGAVAPILSDAATHNAGALITIPMAGYVSADKNGGGDVRNTPNYLQTRFKNLVPRKGSAFALNPDTTDANVYADEFVNWIKTNYAYGQTDSNKPIWFSLDNEPDLWNSTHPEVHAAAPTYAEMIQKTTALSSAIKDVTPNALVFGPVNYGWQGFVRLQDAPDANNRDFQEFYLQQMQQASSAAGKRLIDALDVHWYPEAHGTNNIRIVGFNGTSDSSPPTVAARLQAPRSLWDPTYTESSWITQFSTNGPINLIPRLKTKINTFYPGTKLAITEYNYGGGNHISGAIAQADVLGIFGRESVFAANEWKMDNDESFIRGGFQMFRNFDGASGSFGDTSIRATTSNVANTSVYASYDSSNRNVLTIVAINKTPGALTAGLSLNHLAAGSTANVYQLTGASANPIAAGSIAISNPNGFDYTMPAYSVSTIKIILASPAPRAWTGGGDNVHWSDANNWSGNALPSVNDDVVISVPNATATTVLDAGNVAVRSITTDENLTVSNNARLTVSAKSTIAGALSIQSGGAFVVQSNGNTLTSANALNISGVGSMLDLNDNDLIVKTTPRVTIENYVKTAYHDGDWTGPSGIFSSAAKNSAAGNTTLGLLSGAEFIDNSGANTFDGQSIDNGDVLIKYTYFGDVDFNGSVDVSDYNLIDFGFTNHPTGWANGDADWSGGATDVSDYNLIDFAFATQTGAL